MANLWKAWLLMVGGIILCLLVSVGILVLAVRFGEPKASGQLPWRVSGDYRTIVLYLGTNVAISKYHGIYSDGDLKTYFTIGRVGHWTQPDLVVDTGDRFDETVRGLIARAGISTEGRWLLTESEDFDWDAGAPVAYVTAIALGSGKMYSATNIVELRRLSNDQSLSTSNCEPVAFFFDHALLSRVRSESD
jgi:hypothetical protein